MTRSGGFRDSNKTGGSMNRTFVSVVLGLGYGTLLYAEGALLPDAAAVAAVTATISFLIIRMVVGPVNQLPSVPKYQMPERPRKGKVTPVGDFVPKKGAVVSRPTSRRKSSRVVKYPDFSQMTPKAALKKLHQQPKVCARPLLIGAGCAGVSTVDGLLKSAPVGVDTLAIDSDLQVLRRSTAAAAIYTGAKQRIGAFLSQNREQLQEIFEPARAVIIVAGLGGKSGTTAAKMLVRYAKNTGKSVHVYAITPFEIEGKKRATAAEQALVEINKYADSVLPISNQDVEAQFSDYSKFADVLGQHSIFLRSSVCRLADMDEEYLQIPTVMRRHYNEWFCSDKKGGVI